MSGMKQNRRFPRRKFREKVGVLCRGHFAVDEAVEIGEGGMLICPSNPVEIGGLVTLSFFIPLKDFVSVMGQIIYQGEGRLWGVKFLDLDFNSKRSIRDYIALKSAAEAENFK